MGAQISPDGNQVAFADRGLQVWEISGGRLSRAPQTFQGSQQSIHGIAFSPDGRLLAAITGGKVEIWEVKSGLNVRTLQGRRCSSIAFDPKSSRIVTTHPNEDPIVWDITTGNVVAVYKGHSRGAKCAIFSPQGDRVASGAFAPPSTVDRRNGDPFATSPSVDSACPVKIWDPTSGREVYSLNGHAASVSCLAFSRNGKRLVSGGQDNVVRVWDADQGKESTAFRNHADAVVGVTFCNDGRKVASYSSDGMFRIWDVSTGHESFSFLADDHCTAAFDAEGKRLVLDGVDALRAWDVSAMEGRLLIAGHTFARFSPDGKSIVAPRGQRELAIWSAGDGKLLRVLTGHQGPVTCAAFNRDGKLLASASEDKSVRIWDVDSGHEVAALPPGQNVVKSLVFLPEGALAIADGVTVKVYNPATGKELFSLHGHTNRIVSVGMHPAGERIVATSDDGSLRLWDLQSHQEVLALAGCNGPVAFCPRGFSLAAAQQDQECVRPARVKLCWGAPVPENRAESDKSARWKEQKAGDSSATH